jgi:predicted CXXCH cytochrome family protein
MNRTSGLLLALTFIAGSTLVYGAIETTKHNLSVSGTGDIRAASESQICIFCHTPHNASPQIPLWNRQNPGQNYIPYSSSTIDAAPGQPTGASQLCLSCHDGTIALGDLLSRDTDVQMTGGVTVMPNRRSNLGTDLSDDHPISFPYTESLATLDGKLASPSTLVGPVKLDASGQLQCTSCHDPHEDRNGKFLVMSDANGALCETCHTIYHKPTVHQISAQPWDGVGPDPWPNTEWTTVRENSCYNCHTPHAAGGERLLKHAEEEQICLDCHNGHVTHTDSISTAFQKPFRHPLDLATGVHDPVEDALVTDRHVECQDCHNPHAAQPWAGGASDLPAGVLRDVGGITIGGSEIFPITVGYQLCFRCHGDTQPTSRVYTNRLVPEANVRLDFSPSNASFHPVASPGRNPDVPSLLPPWNTGSTIECIFCHSNDNAPDHGPSFRGPHGSVYRPILVRQYITMDPNPESASAYALCYKCHDRNSILGDQSFSKHDLHISGRGMGGGGMGGLSTPCNVCHDPHGVRATGRHSGTKLINFDLDVVQPNSDGLLYYESTGSFEGSCYLSCHGKNHNPCSYGGSGGGGMGGGCMGGGGGGGGGG